MLINKIGSYHTSNGINNQDSGFEFQNINCIVDGCSGGKHSEVGAKLYVKKLFEYLKQREAIGNVDKIEINDLVKIFENILGFVARSLENYSEYLIDVHNYMLFTILYLEEDQEGWDFFICGDGFVITQDLEDKIKFFDIDHASAPMYLAYSYVKEESLDLPEIEKGFSKNPPFKVFRFSKDEFKAVGIASDGISYVVNTHYEETFKKLLLSRKDFLINRFINKMNYSVSKVGGSGFFKDDITIAMR